MGSSIVCPLHQKPVSFLNLSSNISLEQRVLCAECDPENPSLTNLDEAMKKWQAIETKMITKFSSFKSQKIDQLQSLTKLFTNYREAMLKSVNAVLETIDDYKNQFARALDREIQYIKQISEEITFQKLIDIALILSDKLIEQESENDHIGNLNLENILKKEKLLFQELKKQNILIQQETVKIIAQNQDEIKPKPINYQLMQTIKQAQDCFAISFNRDSSMMISGSGKDIKVWNVENEKINHIRTLEGHNYNVNCICFSKLSSFFLSGGCDNQVRVWNQKSDWKCDQVLNEHNNSVCCIILNKNETQFFTSGLDNFIKIHQKQENDEKWLCTQTLIGHSGSVYCITLNDSENQLASCSRDKSIIIWEVGENQQWAKKQQIVNEDYGYRICFISKNTFVWQKYGNGETIIYQFDNSEQLYSVIKQINLKAPTMDGHYLFPSIYNSNNQILIQKHSKYLYIIRKLQNNKYAVLQTIEFSSSSSFGTLCYKGDILAVWNDRKKEIQVWKNQ